MPAIRPFEPTGLSTKDWKLIKPQFVDVSELVLVQDIVSIKGLINAMRNGLTFSGDTVPHVVVYRGKKYLASGYHRYVIALVREEPLLIARVFEK